MKYNRINIGQIVKEKVAELGISKMRFAEMIGLKRQNIEKTIFLKHGLDTDLLMTIGEALDYDFFLHCNPTEEVNKKDYIKPIRGKLILEFGGNRKEQILKFELGENNI